VPAPAMVGDHVIRPETTGVTYSTTPKAALANAG
jgi:hypothetical protein